MSAMNKRMALLFAGLGLGLGVGCDGKAVDRAAVKSGSVGFEVKRNPHGGNGLGAGGQMTDNWMYPEEQGEGEGNRGNSTTTPGTGKAEPGHGARPH